MAPDEHFWNSKYWFRRVGAHPVFPALCQQVRELAHAAPAGGQFLSTQAAWDPMAFVDLCEQAAKGGPAAKVCRQAAQCEWRLLFDHCFRAATGQ